jgi:hypothetical protein
MHTSTVQTEATGARAVLEAKGAKVATEVSAVMVEMELPAAASLVVEESLAGEATAG